MNDLLNYQTMHNSVTVPSISVDPIQPTATTMVRPSDPSHITFHPSTGESWWNGKAWTPAQLPRLSPAPVHSMPPMPAFLQRTATVPQTSPMAAVLQVPPLIEWIGGADFHGSPPEREWLVHDMIPMNTVTLLYGDGGTGKSLLALQLAVSTVLGGVWLNRVPGRGSVLYYSAEDDRTELHRRLATIAGTMGATMTDLSALTIANMAGRDALLAAVSRRSNSLIPNFIFDGLNEKIAQIAPRLIVLDTLADIYPGNENDRAQARQFIGILRGLAIKYRCAVLLLAHPSLTGISTGTGASGSTAWKNSVRSQLYFDRVKSEGWTSNPDARQLKVMKSNYGQIGIEISVVWKGGIFIAQQDGQQNDNMARAERIFITLLGRSASQGRHFSSNFAPAEFAKMPGSEGLTKQILKMAMERLFESGRITVANIIENRRQRKIIAVTDNI